MKIKIIFGAVYRRRGGDSGNDQHYHYYIPVAYKKDETTKYRMVDTYMVQNPCWGNTDYAKKLWYLEQANCGETSWQIFAGHREYYYQNYYDIGSLELDDAYWEMIGDLHEYRIISDGEAEEYTQEDLLKYLPLWNEDFYRWGSGLVGSCFVKKDAKKDGWLIYDKSLRYNNFGFTSSYRLNDLEKTCKDVLGNMKLGYGKKKKIKTMLKKIRKYRKLSREYDEFCKNLKESER
jgi:hypothetical protein